ncbi:hypothetical protein TNCV_1240471 [Trichonephila clavipes]|uniref:Uncharacterized protein n=1 Tax=Trichonephila clavipes TaxID=2585209 RepID=A0A8X7BIN6_TRICX|nr:hypothetical protein TNCV_1240471 [Trichonephila clavipes]
MNTLIRALTEKWDKLPQQLLDNVVQIFIATKSTVQLVEELIWAYRRVTIDSIAVAIGCSHGLVYIIMHDRLNFRKVCANLVSPATDQGTQKRFEWAIAVICLVARNNILEANNLQRTTTFNMKSY